MITFHCFRHCHCELDFNCPFIILLEYIETILIANSEQIVSKNWHDLQDLIFLIDRHFSSVLHFTNFRPELGLGFIEDFKINVLRDSFVPHKIIDLTQRTRTASKKMEMSSTVLGFRYEGALS